MSDAIYPALSGLTWPIIKIPEMRTLTQESASGKTKSAALWSYPRWHFTLEYEFLKDDGTPNSDIQKIIGFFLQRFGAHDDFLFFDKIDHKINGQIIGVGDGTAKDFQLVRNYGGFIEPIFGILTAPAIVLSNSTMPPFTWNTRGLISFAAPPPPGVNVLATATYYYRVKFKMDMPEFEHFNHRLWSAKSVELVSQK